MSQSASRTGLRQWKLWSLSAPLITALLAVESCAVLLVLGGLLLPSAALVPADPHAALRTAALIVVVAALHTELGRDAERLHRNTLAGEMHINMASVWFFAAAALLSPGGAAGAAVQAGVHHGGVRAGHGGGVGRDGLAAGGPARRVRRARARGRAAGVLHRQHGVGGRRDGCGGLAVGRGPGRRHARRKPPGDRHLVRRRAGRGRDGGQPVAGPAGG